MDWRFVSYTTWVLLITFAGCSDEPTIHKADQHLITAKDAMNHGDTEMAMSELNLALEDRPDVWAYLERAKLHLQLGNEEATKQDIAQGLELDPENADLLWLKNQMAKPKSSRFHGADADPPSDNK